MADSGIGRAAAAAVIQGADAAKGEKRKLPVVPFKVVSFRLPNKSEAFKNDDGSTTQRLAQVLISLAGSRFTCTANIYKTTSAGNDTDIYCAMPSTGKRFMRPVFVTDDEETQIAYDEWRVSVVNDYAKWARNLNAETGKQVQSGSSYRVSAKSLGL